MSYATPVRVAPSALVVSMSAVCGAALVLPSTGCDDPVPLTPEGGVEADGSTPDASVPAPEASPGTDATFSDDGPGSNEVLLISETRTHGTNGDGYGDDFIEIYNPGSTTITLDASWKVLQLSAQGAACQGAPITMFIGAGQVMPPHAHLLMGGWEYVQSPPADVPLMNSTVNASVADAGSLWIVHGSKVVDALCFYYDATTLGYLSMTCTYPYVCRGTPVSNLPHDGSSQASSAVNAALERLPGGDAGNTQNTGDNAADFHMIMPANPQNLHSPPMP